jgi:hypothetical protein
MTHSDASTAIINFNKRGGTDSTGKIIVAVQSDRNFVVALDGLQLKESVLIGTADVNNSPPELVVISLSHVTSMTEYKKRVLE